MQHYWCVVHKWWIVCGIMFMAWLWPPSKTQELTGYSLRSHQLSSSFFAQGKGTSMKPTTYKHLKSLRLWKAVAGDAGVGAVVRFTTHHSEAAVTSARLQLGCAPISFVFPKHIPLPRLLLLGLLLFA